MFCPRLSSHVVLAFLFRRSPGAILFRNILSNHMIATGIQPSVDTDIDHRYGSTSSHSWMSHICRGIRSRNHNLRLLLHRWHHLNHHHNNSNNNRSSSRSSRNIIISISSSINRSSNRHSNISSNIRNNNNNNNNTLSINSINSTNNSSSSSLKARRSALAIRPYRVILQQTGSKAAMERLHASRLNLVPKQHIKMCPRLTSSMVCRGTTRYLPNSAPHIFCKRNLAARPTRLLAQCSRGALLCLAKRGLRDCNYLGRPPREPSSNTRST